MLVIGVRDKPMKMGLKKLMVLRPLFGLNNEYGGNFKGRCLPLMGLGSGRSPLATHAIQGFSDPAHAIWWVAEAFPLLQNPKSWV